MPGSYLKVTVQHACGVVLLRLTFRTAFKTAKTKAKLVKLLHHLWQLVSTGRKDLMWITDPEATLWTISFLRK